MPYHCLTTSSDDEAAPAQRPAARRRNTPPEVIHIDTPPASDDSGSSMTTAPEPYPSSTAAPTPRALTPATTTTTTKRRARTTTRRGEYSFSAQPAATPSLSLKTMKQTIKDAGLGVADLFERKDVEERYAQAKARLAEAERLKRRSRDDDGAPAPKAPRVAPPRPPRPSQPRARRMAQAPRGVRLVPRTGVRVVHNVRGVEGLSIAYDVCDEARRGADLRRSEACNRGPYEMAFRKARARDGRRTGD